MWQWEMRGKIGLRSESAGLALTDPFQFPLKFTVELAKLPPHIPVTVLGPEFKLELAAAVLTHPLNHYGSLGLGIKGNLLHKIQ